METQFDDGTTSHPYGENCDGRLVYGADGQMAAHLWDPDRHLPDGGNARFPDAVYFSYTGQWHLDDDVMTHHVQAATYPDWTGATIVRSVAWDGDDLLLTARVEFSGKAGTALLRWRKLPRGEGLL